jgi:transglutaminase-like putative cysteine protease
VTGRLRISVQAAIATLAAASALSALFSGTGWIGPVAGGIAVVTVASELVRRSPLPGATGPLLAAAAMVIYLTVLDTRQAAYGVVVPTGASLRALDDLFRSGLDDVRALSTPVPTTRGLVLLAVVGVAAAHLVVDLLAVAMRKAALAGLPLLAVFAVSTSTAKHGVGWLPFVLGATGYLWLLVSDSRERLSSWGRTLGVDPDRVHTRWTDPDVAPSPLAVLGRRVGAAAIAAGLVAPLLVPGLHGGFPRAGHSGAGNGAGSTVVTVNPIVSVAADLKNSQDLPVLSMRSTDSDPGYLRLTSLDHFDGTTFAPSALQQGPRSRVSSGIPAPEFLGTTTTVTHIAIDALDVYWLPAPVQVTKLQVSGDWRYDQGTNTVFSARTRTSHLRYTVTSAQPDPTAAELSTAQLPDPSAWSRYLQLPDTISSRVRALATRITQSAKTPFDKAVAIQRFLTSPPFSYSTSVPAEDSSSALATFLLVSHQGFCQQYAAAMTVLARILHIPARVAVGFTHGARQSDGSWLVTTHDAHAWPELYFPGFGWTAFEPTPRSDGQALAPAYTQRSPTGSTTATQQNTAPSTAASPASSTPLGLKKDVGDSATPAPVTAPARHASGHGDTGWWVLLAVVVIALIGPGAGRAWSRRSRWRHAHTPTELAHAAWDELRATAIDAGADWIDGLTPRATARSLAIDASLDAAASAALGRLVLVEERARYSPEPLPADRQLRRDVATVSRVLTARVRAVRRVRQRLWPRSTLLAVRTGLGRVADVLDTVDVLGARTAGALRSVRSRRADGANALRVG